MARKHKHSGGGGGGGGPVQPLWLHISGTNGRLPLGTAGNSTPPKLQLYNTQLGRSGCGLIKMSRTPQQEAPQRKLQKSSA